MQPPSGGCVLKPKGVLRAPVPVIAAAFGRLCVETPLCFQMFVHSFAAAFGRLCVETTYPIPRRSKIRAAAFGRLCVETLQPLVGEIGYRSQPPSGGCVLKHLLVHHI